MMARENMVDIEQLLNEVALMRRQMAMERKKDKDPKEYLIEDE